MKKAQAEVGQLAADIVNRVVADVLYEFPEVVKAIDDVSITKWEATLNKFAKTVEGILADAFGAGE